MRRLERLGSSPYFYETARTGPPVLRTWQQWCAFAAGQEPPVWRCPNCLRTLPPVTPGMRGAPPCPHCDATPQPAGTANIPKTAAPQPLMETFRSPDTLTRVAALRANQASGSVAEVTPVAVQAVPLPPPPPRATYPPKQATLDAVVQEQVRLGQRPAPEAPLRTMQAAPCGRCGKPACSCPPTPPDVLTACVVRQQLLLARRDAGLRAAFPVLERW
jgi:hypothetical protein